MTPITPAEVAAVDDNCARVMAGAAKLLEECPSGTYQCSGKLVCDKGFCANTTIRTKGQPCANPGDICAAGSHCATDPAKNVLVCLADLVKGDACTPHGKTDGPGPCLATLQCNGQGATGLCEDRIGSGGPCTPGQDQCVAAAPYCHPTLKKCTAGMSFSPMETDTCKPFGG